MSTSTFTLRLSRRVSEALLPDIRALLPAESIQFFSNDLDEEWHYTLLCQRGDDNCSLTVSAISVWQLLGRVHKLHYSNPAFTRDVTHAPSVELYSLLKTPGAVLHVS